MLDEISVASPDHIRAVNRCDDPDLRAAMGPDPYCDQANVKTVLIATNDGGQTRTQIGE